MTTRLRLLDDAAWVSVNDDRVAGAGEVWPVADPFCSCALAWLVVEAFVEVGVDGRRAETRVHGHCVGCGDAGTTDWLAVGRVTGDGFEPASGVRGYQRELPASGCRGEC